MASEKMGPSSCDLMDMLGAIQERPDDPEGAEPSMRFFLN